VSSSTAWSSWTAECAFTIGDAAARTLEFLRLMHQLGQRDIVDGIIAVITADPRKPTPPN
jgi:hypothetical protein